VGEEKAMSNDPELKAMQDVLGALESLDQKARARVLQWVCERLGVAPEQAVKKSSGREFTTASPFLNMNRGGGELGDYSSLGDFFAATNPTTDMEKVLVVSAFLQRSANGEELTGRAINRDLHHLGHRVSNVTKAIFNLMQRKPQLMIQTRKEGKTQQAQKKYRVTAEGFKAVSQMLQGTSSQLND
jgi:hypothetical protein